MLRNDLYLWLKYSCFCDPMQSMFHDRIERPKVNAQFIITLKHPRLTRIENQHLIGMHGTKNTYQQIRPRL